MPITEKECECGCGRKFYGTAKKRFALDTCRAKWHREQKKAKQNDSAN